jgi:hypothetical protein
MPKQVSIYTYNSIGKTGPPAVPAFNIYIKSDNPEGNGGEEFKERQDLNMLFFFRPAIFGGMTSTQSK